MKVYYRACCAKCSRAYSSLNGKTNWKCCRNTAYSGLNKLPINSLNVTPEWWAQTYLDQKVEWILLLEGTVDGNKLFPRRHHVPIGIVRVEHVATHPRWVRRSVDGRMVVAMIQCTELVKSRLVTTAK